MTIPSEQTVSGPYSASGVGPYGFDFYGQSNGDVSVLVNGVKVSNYSIAWNLPSHVGGGSITFDSGTAPANGSEILILLNFDATQATQFSNSGFSSAQASALQSFADRATQNILQLKRAAIRLPLSALTEDNSPEIDLDGDSLEGKAGQGVIVSGTEDGFTLGALASATVSAAMQPVVAAATLIAAQDELGVQRVFNVLNYDQTGTPGNDVVDDGPAFQAAFDAAIAAGGGIVYAPTPSVAWRIETAVSVQFTAAGLFTGARVSFKGDGAGLTLIRSAVSADWAFTFIGGTWGSGGQQVRMSIEGITFDGISPTPANDRRGLFLQGAIFARFIDCHWFQFHRATRLEDTVQTYFQLCAWQFNNRGVEGAPGSGFPGTGSPANIILFDHCVWVQNRNRGVEMDRCTNLTFVGGSFEGAGLALAGISDESEVYCIRLSNGGLNGASALNIYGTHFETNRGDCEILIDHDDFPAVYNLHGVDFLTNGNTDFVDHHIIFNTTGTAAAALNVTSCGFDSSNGYAPSTARRVIHEGTVSGSLHAINLRDNIYSDADEIPSIGKDVSSNLTIRGGLRVGFDGDPTADRIELGDATYFFGFSGSNPIVTYDTGDLAGFNRSTNRYFWFIGNTEELGLNASALFPATAGGLALGAVAAGWNGLVLNAGTALTWDDTTDFTLTQSGGTVTASGALADPVGRLQAIPRSTTVALAAIGNAINTTNKFTDKVVINTTTGAIVTAAGATAGSVWQALDGTTAHTPV